MADILKYQLVSTTAMQNDHAWFRGRVGTSWAFQQPHPHYNEDFIAFSA